MMRMGMRMGIMMRMMMRMGMKGDDEDEIERKSGVICGRLFCCLQVCLNSPSSRTSSAGGLAPLLFVS